jgi:hypothetical protein
MMIVIAVAGSLVTYAWVMGYLSFTTAKAGRAIQIQSIANDETDTDLLVYVQNVGEGVVTLDPTGAALVYVNGGLLPCTIAPADGLLGEGATAVILVPGAAGAPGEQVRVKVVDLGGTFTEAAAYPGESTGGGGGIILPPTVTRVQGQGDSFATTPTEGNLLIVIAGHRTANPDVNHSPTLTGWTLAEVSYYMTSTGNRRIIAMFYKIAGAGEPSTVTIDWNDGTAYSYWTLYQEFTGATTYTKGESGFNYGTGTTGTTLAVPSLPLSAGTTANVLSIGGMVWRDDPGAASFTNLSGDIADDFNGCFGASAFNYGDAVTDTTVTWPTARLGSGLLVQFSCE